MTFPPTSIPPLIKHHYNLDVSASQLPGELDFNFFLKSSDGRSFIFKIANAKEIQTNLELQNVVINHLSKKEIGLSVSCLIPTINGEEIIFLTADDGSIRMARLLTWVEGRVFALANPHSPRLLEKLGGLCGNLCRALSDFDHPAAHRFMKWDPSQATWIKPHLARFKDEQKNLVDHFYNLFEQQALPRLPKLRKSINYNDANDYNVLVSHDLEDPSVPGVIDFGDVVFTNTINELAIAIAYSAMGKPDPLEAACHIVKGFNEKFKITEEELEVLFALIATRLIISVTCSELNRAEHPENVYLQISDTSAWDLLEKLKRIPTSLAQYAFRHACGFIPCPIENAFNLWATSKKNDCVFPVRDSRKAHVLDLSVGSLDLGNSQNIMDPELLDKQVSALMINAKSDMAIGRYNEVRGFYSTDAFASDGNDGPSWRTVHIGIDFFARPGTEVIATLDGIVHSFANNKAERDYGPTIILEHKISNELKFYTLYGHLSSDSIASIKVGQAINKGQVIGRMGTRTENGNWPPHLHFQIMLDDLGMVGDFPDVANAERLDVWKSISPDPWLLLTGQNSQPAQTLSNPEIVAFRKQHLGKNLSISYKEPIKMVRGNGAYLMEDSGKRYLDTVNNVAHVGHEHPRVVSAGQRQMAVLNTNTRYLHENLVRFVEELLSTFPPQLNVAFLVNSGSEANELAMRLAKNYTGQKDMIVSEVGYHGNTNGCIEISSYKFDGPAGKGAAPHIHVVPIPDTYRGLYQSHEPDAGQQYAAHVKHAIDMMQGNGKKPAAFIFESVISCGGQVELPNGFLKDAYQYVRNAGGVCIADEVQTGCGRAGDHYWAFQQHDVVPDIVTIGKPIGNGHPLGVVVTTQGIADAFKNGMEYFNTFGGNPVSCAIGLEVLRVIKDENLQQNAKAVGDYLKQGLRNLMSDFEIIGDVRGPGLFVGFELVCDRITKKPATDQASYFANRMRDKGILMSTDGPFNNVLKIKPPMVFSKSNADFLLDSISKVLKEDFMKPNE
jgi:4-aminobutyrate aminotransferase-like enzyme/Ser/Thr protein kinase RdoA (MazF antagonist)